MHNPNTQEILQSPLQRSKNGHGDGASCGQDIKERISLGIAHTYDVVIHIRPAKVHGWNERRPIEHLPFDFDTAVGRDLHQLGFIHGLGESLTSIFFWQMLKLEHHARGLGRRDLVQLGIVK
jgi:hypothetical protein